MKINFFLVLVILFFQSFVSFSQKSVEDFSILFYNAENLFDTRDEPGKEDDEFTPNGERHWTNGKLNQKLINISKVIMGVSGFNLPGIVAFCEIENREVLERLIRTTPLENFNYKIIHKESPDHRGIDVALFYNADFVYPLTYKFYPLQNQGDTIQTREILYFSAIVNHNDTMHLFVNHWPSRYDGLLETEPMRKIAARLLKSKIQELQRNLVDPKIILMGDFNDQPSDESIAEILDAKPVSEEIKKDQLYNLSIPWLDSEVKTQKYQSQWSVFDQCIVSGTLLNCENGFTVIPKDAKVMALPFLLQKDERYGGKKPFRSYNGYSYEGGFSDHLPIQVTLTPQN